LTIIQHIITQNSLRFEHHSWKYNKSWTDSLFHHRLRLHQRQHLQHNKKHLINSITEEDEEVAEEIAEVVEDVVHSEVEAVHHRAEEEEETSNIKTPIILDMDRILETINQTMVINSSSNILSSIRTINNIRRRSIIKLLNNINLLLDPMSILHLVICKLNTLNLRCRNTDSNPDWLLDKTTNHHMQIKAMPTHHPENAHETKLSETQTEDIP
jgi:hypothetical protein